MTKKSGLLRFLNEMEKEELIGEIEKLCAKFDVVKKYFDIELSGDTGRHVRAAKLEIDRQFYTPKGERRSNPKASRLNAIVRAFELVSIYKLDVIDLLVYRIEKTVAYARDNHGISEALFQSSEIVIRRIRELVASEGAEVKYADRISGFDNPYWRYGKPRDWRPVPLY